MPARVLGLLTVATVACLAGCGPAPSRAARPIPPCAATPEPAAPAGGARWFQGQPEEAFWVRHDAQRDEVVISGARLVLSAQGEIVEAAWDAEHWATGDLLQGSLAVAPHLGGGYLHWSRSGVFRSTRFTGPLERVPLGMPGALVRGARNDLEGVAIFTDAGPRLIPRGAAAARAYPEPAIFDVTALDEKRAARLDVLGRARITSDGGRTWADVERETGFSVRGLVPGVEEISLETWMGRMVLGPDGALGAPDGNYRPKFISGRHFQVQIPGTRADEQELLPWGWRELTPIGAAALGGARLADGSALAVAVGGVARVDLGTGAATLLHQGWIPDGLSCVPHQAPDTTLLLCAWEDYRSYGGYVLRTERGEPPVPEQAFSDDGYYIADDSGAVGYVGSCSARPRGVDPDDPRRSGWGEISPAPVVCVRRGPSDWVERSIELGDRRSLLGWAPRRDGTAVALVRGGKEEVLPHPAGEPRVSVEGGVHVVRVYQPAPDWYFTRPARRGYAVRGLPPVLVDRRFRALDAGEGGGVVAWASSNESAESYGAVSRAVTLLPEADPIVHPLPPDVAGMVVTGDHGLAVAAGGELYETLDHGRTWRPAGLSPVPPSALEGACSAIGCALDGVVRIGWGSSSSAIQAAISPDPAAACRARSGRQVEAEGAACEDLSARIEAREPPAPAPRVSCAPAGPPAPRPRGEAREALEEMRRKAQLVVETGWGEEVLVMRDVETPAPPPEPDGGQGAPPPPPSERAAPPKPRAGPALRTHSLVFRVPFDPRAPLARLNATDAALATGARAGYRRTFAMPLLGAGGELAMLLIGDSGEVIARSRELKPLPLLEPRRYFNEQQLATPGVLLAPDRAVMLGESRRRLYLEEHGPDPQRPPRAVALDREVFRDRTMALARRDDGAIGALVLDGVAPETAGVAELAPDGGIGPVERLAPWSTLTAGDDPRCRALKGAWGAVLVIDPAQDLALDAAALPGVELQGKGLALVRWGRERVCLDALDAVASDLRRGGGRSNGARLIARWSGAGRPAAALVTPEIAQGLACGIAP